MPLNQEIEAKFRVVDPGLMAGLRQIPALAERYRLATPLSVTHEDTYFDTDDLRLLRNGQTLRLRAVGDQVLATFKSIELNSPRGMHKRVEIEREAPGLSADVERVRLRLLPTEVAAELKETVGGKEWLRPIMRLRQERNKRDVYRPDDEIGLLGELSLDHCEVQRRDSRGEWIVAGEFDAVELEAVEDVTAGELKPLATFVGQIEGLKPDAHNKLHQALVCVTDELTRAESAASNGSRRLHMAELCRRVWRDQLLQMVLNEAGVRDSDDIEYVHDMRVATRRARAAARLYAGFFDPGSKRVRRFLKTLRTTGRLLGAVRDMDVAHDNLKRRHAQAGGENGQNGSTGKAGGLEALMGRWQAERDTAHIALLRWLDGADYRRFVVDFRDFCASPGLDARRWKAKAGVAPAPHQVRHVLPSMILSRYETIRAFEVLFEGSEPVPTETIHALRIECKYLRYHLEFNVALLGDEGRILIEDLKVLQEDLGRLNDASVASRMLSAAAVEQEDEGIEGYKRAQDDAVRSLRADVPGDLARFLSFETRRSLALALARI